MIRSYSLCLKSTCKCQLTLEWFSIECRKTKTKVVKLANKKRHRQSSEPIKTRSNYMNLTKSEGKCVRASESRLVLVSLLIGRNCGANFLSQSRSVESAKPITFRHSNKNCSSNNDRHCLVPSRPRKNNT